MPARSRTSQADALEKVAFLSRGCHLAGRPRTVEVIETHFAWVFLAGRRAYKLKKATRQASMDYRTLASREAGCRNELRLNRRLAPRVYARIVPLVRGPSGALSLAARGEVVDWVIEMRRLAGARMLDRAISRRSIRAGDIDRFMRRLARFFRRAKRCPVSDREYLGWLKRQVLVNARELRAPDLGLSRPLVAKVVAAQRRFLAVGSAALVGRGARLRDGHGDLRPQHVYLGSRALGACIIDCLEFDPQLRRLDPAEEIAFLALECARLGAVRLGEDLIARYRRALGDAVPEALVHFYMSRRAAVRAQIMAWHLRDAAFTGEASLWRARARSYLAEALRHARLATALLASGRLDGTNEHFRR
jgi:uncharacterized protein